jgi:transposase InsO family protein
MGIRDRPTAPRSPWQSGHTERLIGSLRRECLDHMVVFGERHLRQLLISYMAYYKWDTLSVFAYNLNAKNVQNGRQAPLPSIRAVPDPLQRTQPRP